MNMQDVLRIARHVGPVLVTWGVAKGYVPETVAGDLAELVTVVLVTAVSIGASKARDVKRAQK